MRSEQPTITREETKKRLAIRADEGQVRLTTASQPRLKFRQNSLIAQNSIVLESLIAFSSIQRRIVWGVMDVELVEQHFLANVVRHRFPKVFIVVKNVFMLGGCGEPAARIQFVLQLSFAPTGIADEQTQRFARVANELIEIVAVRGDVNTWHDVAIRARRIDVNGDNRPLNGTAEMDGVVTIARFVRNLFPDVLDRDVAGTIQDNAQCPVVVVLNHQHHGSIEIRIGQLRHGNQELGLERIHFLLTAITVSHGSRAAFTQAIIFNRTTEVREESYFFSQTSFQTHPAQDQPTPKPTSMFRSPLLSRSSSRNSLIKMGIVAETVLP